MSAVRPPRAQDGRGQGAGREVIIPMPSRKDFGTAHLDPLPRSPRPRGSWILPGSRGWRQGPKGGSGIFVPRGT